MAGYEGRIAVVTGAASGIGNAIARRAAAAGMVVVMADIERSALAHAAAVLRGDGAVVHEFVVDVSDRAAMQTLAQRVADEVGDVWLLVNNAGVFIAAPFLEMPYEQWEFIVGVNLWGVVHGLQAFLPGMVARDAGHVVNTSSVDGIVTVPNAAAYNASKHAVTALSETLHRELARDGSEVGVSVLCPGAVDSGIVQSARRWPARLGPAPAVRDEAYPELDGVLAPDVVAAMTFDAIAERRFWILTHRDQYAPAIRARAEGLIAATNPDDATVDPNFTSASGRTPGQ